MCPQSKSGIRDVKDLFSIDAVVPIAKPARVEVFEHAPHLAKVVSDALDLSLAEMAWAPPDMESPFRRSVDQVRGRSQVRGKFGTRINRRQRRGSAAISIPANQRVNRAIFAERLHPRSKDD